MNKRLAFPVDMTEANRPLAGISSKAVCHFTADAARRIMAHFGADLPLYPLVTSAAAQTLSHGHLVVY
jgi:hypothetical protein